jgi:hypothetical protein
LRSLWNILLTAMGALLAVARHHQRSRGSHRRRVLRGHPRCALAVASVDLPSPFELRPTPLQGERKIATPV